MTLHRARFAPHRWLMLAILALGLVVQPILGSVSELHELTHDVAGTHGSEETLTAGEDDTAGALHVVHHFAHCCGHAVPTAAAPVVFSQISHIEPTSLTASRRVPSGRWLAPFRPPIAA
ncbi:MULTISPECIES: hypothetical protein [Gammaproteobacteria]|jgi:hypothetical protein|uniref:DUF2946 domain-containing protein n=3 Tax=Gammaproteobacteria TaxID=1236 RepID=A0A919DE64_9GAMM|nr:MULTISPECIES: hypothetical protein [Gammaproteobacteria]RRN78228.1 hypothetical protein EIM50_15285 [Pseudoxanthomonas sp. SGD-10]GIV82607.1 MAG: hypothetical protein KatS3mg051_1961 [Anaerolineae bacterium]GIX33142.1 MAG: hypothetical protein KatS3mg125_1098 [Xanthomonadales bacterium]MBA0446555.1 hypothetical protein [Stenotrophomonas maltophilia]MCF3479274.1 hypothetical protein [Stenotrophomonas maltophilia]